MSHQINSGIINKKLFQFVILSLIVISFSFVSYTGYKHTLEETTKKLNEKVILFHFETFSELNKIYEKDTNKHFLQAIKKSKKTRESFEDMLRLIRISTIQNLFVIAKGEENNFYFLLDSDQNSKTRSNFMEPFDPLGSFWNDCYRYKKSQVFHHQNSKDLWITIAYPIIENNQTVAIIGADISRSLDTNIQSNLGDFSNFFLWILLLSALWFVILYVLTLYFRKKAYEGYIDPLTQVYNRKYLYDIVLKKLSRRYQLLMLDIDFFKRVNDAYGHDTGDFVLQEVARRMQRFMRAEDSLIRYGGEEFLIYTREFTPQKALEFAERIREHIQSTPIVFNEISCHVTVSIGVNPYGSKEKPFLEILKKADEALYEAKISGRDCVRLSK
ncbi:diguanylate cyclase [Sulfurimonas sp.]|uniref:sensor domain-containing diguanylate cyclase n=1 Tax=Sulfurimonas sp. TaxID=2022749 RepID=UPI00263862CF|nr:diguanylate cyclase [Sulfurimonas sp.]